MATRRRRARGRSRHRASRSRKWRRARTRVACDYFFSTMPVKELVKQTVPPPPAPVRRSLRTVYATSSPSVAPQEAPRPGEGSSRRRRSRTTDSRAGRWCPGRAHPGVQQLEPAYGRPEEHRVDRAPLREQGEKLGHGRRILSSSARAEPERIGSWREDVLDGCVLRMPGRIRVLRHVRLARRRARVGVSVCRTCSSSGAMACTITIRDHSMLTR